MNLRKTLLAASIAAMPLMVTTPAAAATPVAAVTPQDQSLLATLAQRDTQRGLGSDNNFRLANQHPGADGQKITRVQHTYKGLRVFGSEEVVVTDGGGNIVSVSVADRRAGLDASVARESSPDRNVALAGPQATPLDNVKPAFNADAAIARVAKKVAPTGEHRWPPTAELLIYPVMASVQIGRAHV